MTRTATPAVLTIRLDSSRVSPNPSIVSTSKSDAQQSHPRVMSSYCERCDRYFSSNRALEQHMDDSNMHHLCYRHRKDFMTHQGLIEHWKQSPHHHYCDRCDQHFSYAEDLEEHNEVMHWVCSDCGKVGRRDICCCS